MSDPRQELVSALEAVVIGETPGTDRYDAALRDTEMWVDAIDSCREQVAAFLERNQRRDVVWGNP